MKKAILYIRVSTDEQADKGYSQRHQDELLERYCSLNGIEIVYKFFEDFSAKNFQRPAFNKMLIMLKKHKSMASLLLFSKWDRFSRNAGDAYSMINTLKKIGVEPQAVEQPLDLSVPENKMMLAFYLAAPEVENDRRSLNVTAGMRRAQKEGRWMATAPFGYVNRISEDGKKYIAIDEEKSPHIKWFFEEVAKQVFSVESLIKKVQEQLNLGKNGFWVMLRNPVYCGKIKIKAFGQEPEQVVTGQHEPIISEDLFARVQDVLDGKKRQQSMYGTLDSRFPLRGHLLCPLCSRVLTASSSKGCRKYYDYYHCTGKCKARFSAQKVDRVMLQELKSIKPKPAIVALYKAVLQELIEQEERVSRMRLKEIKDQLHQSAERRSKALELLLADKIGPDDYQTIKLESERKTAMLQSELIDLQASSVDLGTDIEKALSLLSKLDVAYTMANEEEKHELISSIFPEKIVFSGETFRTIRHNEVLRLICNVDKGFSEIKNPAEAGLSEMSPEVFPQRLELWAR